MFEDQNQKLIINNRVRSVWQQEINRSVMSIEEEMNTDKLKILWGKIYHCGQKYYLKV